eukprot:m.932001 g.932001  ORF g.932001 m.932001 type:complete len:51 (-) comp187734_c0_seq1:1-153(-)
MCRTLCRKIVAHAVCEQADRYTDQSPRQLFNPVWSVEADCALNSGKVLVQ